MVGYYPANMETPGFEDEQRTKPQETKDIEGSVTLMSADQAADCLMDGERGSNDAPCTCGPRRLFLG